MNGFWVLGAGCWWKQSDPITHHLTPRTCPQFITHHSAFIASLLITRRAPAFVPRLGRLNLEADVERARRVRERADADEVDARLRVQAHVLERDAARRFEQHAGFKLPGDFDESARLLRRLVVQKEYVRPGLDGVAQVALLRDLDLDLVQVA